MRRRPAVFSSNPQGDLVADGPVSSRGVPWQLVVPLIAALGGVALLFGTLKTDRPTGKAGYSPGIGHQDVDARLWQDPFAVPEKPPETVASMLREALHPDPPDKRRSDLIADFRTRLSTTPFGQSKSHQHQANVLVMPVMISAAGYAEICEQRLRTRVAVLSGLARCGYTPEDTNHIGYFVTSFFADRLDSAKAYPPNDSDVDRRPMMVPYEWFRPATMPMPIYGLSKPLDTPSIKQYDSVLVLWLNEDMLIDRPLMRLKRFVDEVLDDVSGVSAYRADARSPPPLDMSNVTVKVIGPHTSTLLRAMAWERPWTSETPTLRLTIICPTATAATDALLTEANTDDFEKYINQDRSPTDFNYVKFVRVAASDKDLCRALVDELGNREIYVRPANSSPQGADGVGVQTSGDDDVAVVAEWDTFFGRALSLTFAAACRSEQVNVRELSGHSEIYPLNVHPYVYLRGIDGQTTKSEDKPAANADKAGEKATGRTLRPDDPPEGTNESDYLRRLAAQLTDLDTRLRHDGKRLKAVGILGTDVYDKLMILKALRPQLPGVLFFTTGLDARYTMPTEWDAAHNLVVAAGYGQTLHRYFQGDIQPFRDSEQTATYVATLTATGLIKEDAFTPGSPATKWNPPRLYEIARDGAYDLSVYSPPNEKIRSIDEKLDSLQPPRVNLINWHEGRELNLYAFAACVIAAVGCLVVYTYFKGIRPSIADMLIELRKEPVVLFLFVLGVVTALFYWLSGFNGPYGEPFSFINGISVWPTEIVRCTVVILVVVLTCMAEYARKKNNEAIANDFDFTTRPSDRTKLDRCDDPVSAEDVWDDHMLMHGLTARLLLALIFALLYMGATWALIKAAGTPIVPARGPTAFAVDSILLKFVIFILSFYILFTLIGSLNIVRFIDNLSRRVTTYSTEATEKVFAEGINARAKSKSNYFETINDFSDAMDIRLIARRTLVIGRSVYHVIFVFVLLWLSRTRLFDNWDWPPALTASFVINGVAVGFMPFWMRLTADKAKKKAVEALNARRTRLLSLGEKDRVAVVERLIAEVRDEDRGAFQVLSQYPLLNALLLPSGGLGIWIILEYLPQWLS